MDEFSFRIVPDRDVSEEGVFKVPARPNPKRKRPTKISPRRSSSLIEHPKSKTEMNLFPVSPSPKSKPKRQRLDFDKENTVRSATLSSFSTSSPPAISPQRPSVPPLNFLSRSNPVQGELEVALRALRIEDGGREVERTASGYAPAKSLQQLQQELILSEVRQISSAVSNEKVNLPTLQKTSQPDLNCISPQTLMDLVDGKFNHLYAKIIIIDCRFGYEYEGGHIRDAVNIPDEPECARLQEIFDDRELQMLGAKVCFVFHCEFSSHRGPRGYKKIRDLDRKANAANYPYLTFPEMYLLEGGYKTFFESMGTEDYCVPRGYVEMKDMRYNVECKQAMRSRSRSMSKMGTRRHFSFSCSNVFDNSGLTAPPTSFARKSSTSLFGEDDAMNTEAADHEAPRLIFTARQ